MLRWMRIGLLYEAVAAALVGLWALPAPRSFFDDFPGLGMNWAAAAPPFNEHYIRDVGALYLGFAVLFVWAAVRPVPLTTPVAATWALVQVPHLVFHLAHDENLSSREWTSQAFGLAVMLVVAVALAVAGRRLSGPTGSPTTSG
jgi:uncharacterized MAPEG superfamily protein